MSADQLRTAAMQLSPDERAALAEQLLASLDAPNQADQDAAWALEAESRVRAYEAGEISATPADDLFSKLDKRSR